MVRPLRQLIETQHKIRKGVESMVDKTTKNLHDWRAAESKAKKQGYSNCRENEKIQDMMLEARLGRGKTLTDKETIKVRKLNVFFYSYNYVRWFHILQSFV